MSSEQLHADICLVVGANNNKARTKKHWPFSTRVKISITNPLCLHAALPPITISNNRI